MTRNAYLILAHECSMVLETLLSVLDDERNDIYLHVDGKVPNVFHRLEGRKLNRATLYLLPRPIKVYWGHTSQVEAELLLMEMALAHGSYVYYHLLSDSDLPVKSQDEIHRFFSENAGKEFIGFWNDEGHRRDALRKIRYYYLFNRWKKRSSSRWIHVLTTPLRNLILGAQKVVGVNRQHDRKTEIKKGFNWFSITEECCRFVLSQREYIRNEFRYTLCPDEFFLQTVVWNSPFREHLYDADDAQLGSMRAIDWQRGSPYIWHAEDVDYLLHSPYLFARKFASSEMAAVKDISLRIKMLV